MMWKGRELRTAGDVMDALFACDTREEAQVFMDFYEEDNQDARANVRYMLGYYEPEEQAKFHKWCNL